MEKLNVKRLIILCLPIVFALSLAITLAACMAQAGKQMDDSALDGSTTEAGESETKKPIQSVWSEGLKYEKRSDGTAVVVGIGTCRDSYVKIPEKDPDGARVIAIGDSAFIGNQSIRGVTLPTSLREIGAYAFYGSTLENIVIGASVEKIGECCFASCKSLTSVTVDMANAKYSSIDGVLFSKDKTVLICYPSGKSDEEYTIRFGVESISSAAFYECVYLKKVKFNGKSEDWDKVRIGANNTSLTSLQITFSKEDEK